MAKNPKTVNDFLNNIYQIVTPLEQKEMQELRQFKAKTLNIPVKQAEITRWNVGYWTENYARINTRLIRKKCVIISRP
jgi:thimet oligopeptidase